MKIERSTNAIGRSPHGERGLKYGQHRAAWRHPSRSPHGERGLKCTMPETVVKWLICRSPHGERGLK